ncbi:MAG: PilN domain-containing protein [Porticoccaceae bacterium]|jgi:type IV pilus assembly protein PilN
MSQINLLPWREEAREQLKKEYLGLLGLVAIGAAVLLFIWITVAMGQLDNQRQRNSYLEMNIAEMNKKVSEISDLKRKKEEMILRMKVIQDLQGTRSEIVKIFDELVRAMPEGTYLSSLEREAAVVKMSGFAESNNRISALMRNLDRSHRYENSNLARVEHDDRLGAQSSLFDLQIEIQSQSADNQLASP